MLLYTTPLNDERQARGQLPVNSMWVSGTGRLPEDATPATEPQVNTAMRAAALRADWPAWSVAWEQLDVQLADNAPSRITLCGERGARSWSALGTRTLAQRLGALWRGPALAETLESL